jgi:hypothetical protein
MNWTNIWENIKNTLGIGPQELRSPPVETTPTPTPTSTPTPTPTSTPTQPVDPEQIKAISEYYGQNIAEKITKELPVITKAAEEYNVPVDILLSQYWQESSFGTNPAAMEENEATALGPMQITRRTAQGGYPAFPDLKIPEEDRTDLGKSMEFAAKHYRYLSDYFKSPHQALSSYYGDPSYADLIKEHTQSPQIKTIMEYLKTKEI